MATLSWVEQIRIWVEPINDGVAFLAILATLVALAVAFAPALPERRLTAPAKRMRDTGRY